MTLILGRKCNMNCPHCGSNRNNLSVEEKVDPEQFIDWFADFLLLKDDSKYFNLMFWGGEPLVYEEEIFYIIKRLESKNLNQHLTYKIFTNGLLLNRKNIKVLEEYNFHVVLSYDSPEPSIIRSNVPSAEIIDLFNNYKGAKSVQAVYNSQFSLVDMYIDLQKKFPNAMRKVGFLRSGPGVPSELCSFPKNKIYNDVIQLFLYYKLNGYPKDITIFKKFYTKYDKLSVQKANADSLYCDCYVNFIPLDLTGKAYICHNSDIIIGNFFEEDNEKIYKRFLNYLHATRPDKCLKCKYLPFCPSGCPVYEYDCLNGNFKQCDVYTEYFDALYDIVCNDVVHYRY